MHVIIQAKTRQEWALYDLLQRASISAALVFSSYEGRQDASHVISLWDEQAINQAEKEGFCKKQESPLLLSLHREEKTRIFLADLSAQTQKALLVFLGFHSEILYFTLWNSGDLESELALLPEKIKGLQISLVADKGILSGLMIHEKKERLDQALLVIRSLYSPWEFSAERGDLAFALQERMVHAHKTLALAESCTGGYLAHLITQNAGASDYFLGSLVTYSNECKHRILQISEENLASLGAVSAPIAISMLEGIFKSTSADLGAAITGVAGPDGGSTTTPVGMVWIAIGERGGEKEITCLHLPGFRKEIIVTVATLVLGALYKKMRAN